MLVWFPWCIFLLIWRKERKVFTPTRKPNVYYSTGVTAGRWALPRGGRGTKGGKRLLNKGLCQQCRGSGNALERKDRGMVDTSR